jgi:RNA polymerase sigma-70 factor (ECF subfamily)
MTKADQPNPASDPQRGDVIDAQAFTALFEESYPKLWLVAASVTSDRSHADDIVQEAAIVALDKLDQFQKGTNFTAWMAKMVRFTALNHIRKKIHRNTPAVDPVIIDQSHRYAGQLLSRDAIDDAGNITDHQDYFDDQVVGALDSLSDVSRACLLLKTVGGMTYEDIALTLGIAEGTAMSHVSRAKKALRGLLEDEYAPKPIEIRAHIESLNKKEAQA